MRETHSGSTRSKAVANTTRVEERNTDPVHPKNQRDSTATRMDLQHGVAEEHRGEQPRIRPRGDRSRSGPEGAVGRVVEVPPEGLGEEEEQDHGEDGGEDQGSCHRVDVLAEVRGAPDLAVERRAPVGVQVEEGEERDQEQGRVDGVAGREAAGFLTGLDGRLVGVATGAEEVLGP